MSDYTEFEGKEIDEAIAKACRHFDKTRDKLEIDILSDAKSGIFGLVGAKKAKIRARVKNLAAVMATVEEHEPVEDERIPDHVTNEAADPYAPNPYEQDPYQQAPPQSQKQGKGGQRKRPAKAKQGPGRQGGERGNRGPQVAGDKEANGNVAPPEFGQGSAPARPKKAKPDGPKTERQRTEAKPEARPEARPEALEADQDAARADGGKKRRRGGRGRRRKPKAEAVGQELQAAAASGRQERREKPVREERRESQPPPAPSVELSAEEEAKALALGEEIVRKLVEPLVGEAQVNVRLEGDRVRVGVDTEEDSGLLIGRDGQTLQSLQYLAGRIMAKQWPKHGPGNVRLSLDIGAYKTRQDEDLKKLALDLADKVLDKQKPQSTKPLSSYHRRIVHLALQDDERLQTRSKGDGPLKRVLIMPRRGKKRPEAEEALTPEPSDNSEALDTPLSLDATEANESLQAPESTEAREPEVEATPDYKPTGTDDAVTEEPTVEDDAWDDDAEAKA